MMLTPLVIMPRMMEFSNVVDGMAWAALSDIGLTYKVIFV